MTLRVTRFIPPSVFRLVPLACAALLAACASPPMGTDARTATIQRTAHGVPHITAGDPETLAYAMAYAYAQDNVCMTANQLVTVRGERCRCWAMATVSPNQPMLLRLTSTVGAVVASVKPAASSSPNRSS